MAEAKPAPDFALDPPLSLSFMDAVCAMPRYIGFREHTFPRCFVCGPQRNDADGLRIFPGRVDGEVHAVAAPWTPNASLAGAHGIARSEFMWAALDCPGAFALMGDRSRPMLLGHMTAKVHAPVRIGEHYVVIAWRMGVEGRKQLAGSAVLDGEGTPVAVARATWFDLPSQ